MVRFHEAAGLRAPRKARQHHATVLQPSTLSWQPQTDAHEAIELCETAPTLSISPASAHAPVFCTVSQSLAPGFRWGAQRRKGGRRPASDFTASCASTCSNQGPDAAAHGDASAFLGSLATSISGRRRSKCLQRAFQGTHSGKQGFAEAANLAAYVQQQGVPAACLPQCMAALQACVGPLCRHSRTGLGTIQRLAGQEGALCGHCDFSACLRQAGTATAKGSAWRQLVAGAAAGAASRTATAPLETVRLQAMTGAVRGGEPLAAARSVVAASGWQALYRGNATNVMRSAPQKALDFFAFDAFKALGIQTFAAAGLAGAVSNALLYPLEVVRTRLTADNVGRYSGVGDAFSRIVQYEGVRGLYRGLLPSVAAIIPEAAITYGMFDTLKKRHARRSGREPGVLPALAYGVTSAFMGQVAAFPLETVSRRLQVDCGPLAALGFRGMLRQIVREEGPLALYRGLGAASMRVVPMACVSFGTYELVHAWLTALDQPKPLCLPLSHRLLPYCQALAEPDARLLGAAS